MCVYVCVSVLRGWRCLMSEDSCKEEERPAQKAKGLSLIL